MSLPHHSLLILLAFGLCQCSTNLNRNMTIDVDDRVVVIFHQPASPKVTRPLTQTLVTEPVVENRQRFYSDPGTDQLTKVLPVENMQLLLDGLATAGFFARARQQVMPGSTAYLQADFRGESYFLSRTAGMEAAERLTFTRSWIAFQDIYNATAAYRSGDDNNAVLRKHEEQQRRYRNRQRLDLGRGRR